MIPRHFHMQPIKMNLMFQISVTIYKQEAFMFITYLHRIYIRDNKGVFFYEPLIKQRNPHNDHIWSAKTNIKTVDLNIYSG